MERCELLDGYSATVEAWTLNAVELLADKPPEIALRLPCPSCGARFVRRNVNGENVCSSALRGTPSDLVGLTGFEPATT